MCDEVDSCVGNSTHVASAALAPGAVYECVGARTLLLGRVTAKETCTTCAASVVQGRWVWTKRRAITTARRAVAMKLRALARVDCDGNALVVEGCTDGLAPNYNPDANVDDGTCFVGGCILPSACNFNPEADYYPSGLANL